MLAAFVRRRNVLFNLLKKAHRFKWGFVPSHMVL